MRIFLVGGSYMPIQYNGKNLVFGLDIGTRSVVGTLGYKEQERFFVVAQKVLYHDTRAMMDGQIHDIAKVGETISKIKEALEQEMNITLTEVCIAAAGRVLKTAIGVCEEELEDEMIMEDEQIYSLELLGIEKAHDQILEEVGNEEKFICVGYSVIRYFLNGFAITSLAGHKAHRVGAEVLATFLPEEVVDGLYAAVKIAGLSVVNLTLEPIAAMQVAIPEQYRLLNLALVDVGAGTSDICITKGGSIVAYGMIPCAGDELTEVLVQKYLVDFKTAESIKMLGSGKKVKTYKDIMGIKQKITKDQVDKDLKETIGNMTGQIAEQIKELNGGKSVNAVFVVGGGGKVSNFTSALAKGLGLANERVALRGQEVMGNVVMLDEKVKKDSLLVTPIGICLNYYENKNNFIFVQVNGQRVKLYNNNKLTVVDAALQVGYPKELMFPRRGADTTFTINGKQRIVRGRKGEAAIIRLNGKEVGITKEIQQDDKITITESGIGEPAYLEIGHLPEYSSSISFKVNNKTVTCPKFAMVNETLKSEFYAIQDGDMVQILDYYTVEQLLMFLDIPKTVTFYINHEKAELSSKIYENFTIDWAENTKDAVLLTSKVESLKKEEQQAKISSKIDIADTYDELVQEEFIEENASIGSNEVESKNESEQGENATKEVIQKINTILVQVNDTKVTLKGKESYIYVDILDFYPFDITKMGGEELVTTVNGAKVDFTAPLHNGDRVELYWRS